ncbi:MAG: response regulator [Desulfobacterales bacterium]|nr:response regulator [Desulfobacterales bacterium]
MKILIAEDDAITLKMLERKLGSWGYEVVSFTDGKAAWEKLQQDDALNLLLLDWMMPGMDGIEICRKLNQQPKDTPTYIILLTARDQEDDIVAGLDAGADDYITKPFGNNELRSRINVGRRILALQNALLEKEKLQAVFETAGAVCHEMNQPLQVVSGVAELLLLDVKTTDPHYEKLTTLMEQTERMGQITNKLMKITKYETKKYLKSKIVDIDKASKETL